MCFGHVTPQPHPQVGVERNDGAGRARIANKSLDEVRADAMANQSIKQMVDPKDIAQLAVYLASPAAKAISGQAIPIDNDRQKS